MTCITSAVIADDYDAMQAQLSALLGYRWGDEIHLTMPLTFASGETREVSCAFCYSIGDEPRLEIVRTVSGTVWQPSSAGWHHFGYWSDDVAADAAELEKHGYAMELFGPGPDGEPLWGYYRHPSGPRIEIVRRGPTLDQYFIDGKNPFG